jgi:methylglutaconyl-CoA hydratase
VLPAVANRLAHMSPKATVSLKRIFWEGTEHWETLLFERAAMSGRLILDEFAQNAISAAEKKSDRTRQTDATPSH